MWKIFLFSMPRPVEVEGRIAPKSVPVPVLRKDNASGQIEGKKVGVKMRKPVERDRIGGGWRLGICGTKVDK
jgi:hypothetical protein